MKTTPLLLLMIFSAMCLSMKCVKTSEDCHRGLYLNNQSDKNVFAVCSFDYPDTSLNFQNPSLSYNNYASAGGRYLIYSTGDRCLEGYMENFMKTDTLSIFLFDAADVQADWSEVRRQYKVLKRYGYTLQDLQNINFTLDYP